jgi:hypothetical protein
LQKNAFASGSGGCPRPGLRIDEIGVEEKFIRLLANGFHDMGMTVSGAGDRVTTIQVEILLIVVRVDPDAFAAFSRDRHLLVSCELKVFFAFSNFGK